MYFFSQSSIWWSSFALELQLLDMKLSIPLVQSNKFSRFVQFGADQDCHCGAIGCRRKLGVKPTKSKISSDAALKLVACQVAVSSPKLKAIISAKDVCIDVWCCLLPSVSNILLNKSYFFCFFWKKKKHMKIPWVWGLTKAFLIICCSENFLFGFWI